MDYKISENLLNGVMEIIANARSTGFNYVELNSLIKQLSTVPIIEIPKKETKEKMKRKKSKK